MNKDEIRKILEGISNGGTDLESALNSICTLNGIDDLGYARLDTHREKRTGIAEVVFAPGKSDEQLIGLVERFLANENKVLLTRLSPNQSELLLAKFPQLVFNESARTLRYPEHIPQVHHPVGVVTAGTSDFPVAEEAMETLIHFGHPIERIADIGVAGIHRVFNELTRLRSVKALIVIAGMEGALPSVVAGLVDCPVVAVPTSIGYGASFGGISALLGMLNSCASGIGVVNIDNGFGAATLAHRIARCEKEYKE